MAGGDRSSALDRNWRRNWRTLTDRPTAHAHLNLANFPSIFLSVVNPQKLRYSLSLLKFGTRQSINDSRRLMYVPTSNYRQMRGRSVGRSSSRGKGGGIDYRGSRGNWEGEGISIRKSNATCCRCLRRRVRVPFGSPFSNYWRIVRFFFLLLLPMQHFTAHSRNSQPCIHSEQSRPPLPSLFLTLQSASCDEDHYQK